MAQVYPTATCHPGHTEFRFPYDPGIVAEFKTAPAHARSYDPKTRTWTIREPHAERMLAFFVRQFPHAAVIGEQGGQRTAPPPPPKSPPAGPHAMLFLLPTAPPEVIDAAYRALVKLHHPDRLPEPEKVAGTTILARINVAYARLTAGRGAS